MLSRCRGCGICSALTSCEIRAGVNPKSKEISESPANVGSSFGGSGFAKADIYDS
jgi:hypothetical protein